MLDFISHDLRSHSNRGLYLGKAEYLLLVVVGCLPFLGSDPILQNLVFGDLPPRRLPSGHLFVGSLLNVDNVLDFACLPSGGWGYLLGGKLELRRRLQLLSQVGWVEGDLVSFDLRASVGVLLSVAHVFEGLAGVLGQGSCLLGDWREHVRVGGSATGAPTALERVTLLHQVAKLVQDLLVSRPGFKLRSDLLLSFELVGMQALCNLVDLVLSVLVAVGL